MSALMIGAVIAALLLVARYAARRRSRTPFVVEDFDADAPSHRRDPLTGRYERGWL